MTPATVAPSTAREPDGERGTGLVPSLAGVVVFLSFVLFATQLLFNLYATSAVTAATYDAARIVAGSDGGPAATGPAEEHARRILGRAGRAASFEWHLDDDTVALHVRSPNPRFVLPVLGGALGFDTVDRTVRVRREALR